MMGLKKVRKQQRERQRLKATADKEADVTQRINQS